MPQKKKENIKSAKDSSGYVYAEKKTEWIEIIDPKRFNDTSLNRITTFFLFHTPCEGLSAMGITLENRGWKEQWKKPIWLNRQLKDKSSNPKLLFSSRILNDMKRALKEADLLGDFPPDNYTERIGLHDNKNNQFMSVFYHLRNTFAHGRFKMVEIEDDVMFYFEDISPQKDKNGYRVSARMVLRQSTLLNWIELIESIEKQ